MRILIAVFTALSLYLSIVRPFDDDPPKQLASSVVSVVLAILAMFLIWVTRRR